jgi:hypothetical protein
VTATYGYDGLNRLMSTTESGTGTATQAYGYDSVGNRWVKPAQSSLVPSQWTPTDASWYDGPTNRLSNASFSSTIKERREAQGI